MSTQSIEDLYESKEYALFVESMVPHCHCKESNRPCDDLQDEPREALEDEEMTPCRICQAPSSSSLCPKCSKIGVPRINPVKPPKPEKLVPCKSCGRPTNPDFPRCKVCTRILFLKEL